MLATARAALALVSKESLSDEIHSIAFDTTSLSLHNKSRHSSTQNHIKLVATYYTLEVTYPWQL